MNRNTHLDALRAYAVTIVLGYHAFPAALPGGLFGVDVFFVLSGYFIARTIGEGQDFHPLRYLGRRLIRLYPALLLVLAATFVAGWMVLLPRELSDLSLATLRGLVFAGNLLPGSADYHAPATQEQSLAHLWSLGVEMQTYLAAALLLPFLVRRLGAARTYAAVFVISLVGAILWTEDAGAFYHPGLRAWEFSAGALVANLRLTCPPRPALLLATLAAALLPIMPSFAHPGLGTIPAVALAVLCISMAQAPTRRPSPPAAALLGRASYSIYLWHWPILVLWGLHDLGPTGPGEAALALFLSVFLGLVSYGLIERPFLSRSSGRGVGGAAGLASFALAVAALATGITGGAPGRLPPDAAAFIELSRPSHPRLAECHVIAPMNLAPSRQPCSHNDDGTPVRIALWGDSHAAALAGGLIRAEVAFREYSFSGCPPAPGIAPAARWAECVEFNQRALKALEEDRSIDLILVVARWPLYAEGAFDNGRGGREPLPSPVLLAAADQPATAEDLFAGLRAAAERLTRQDKTVLLVAPPPDFGWPGAEAEARRAWTGQQIDFSLDRARHAARRQRTIAALENIARMPGVSIFDPDPFFCRTASHCSWTAPDGTLLLEDQDHLSAAGADLIVQALRPHLAVR